MSHAPSNLTRFFRNSAHFKALEHVIVPEVVSRKTLSAVSTIFIWSVGCSTGEEPYSLAILLYEILPTEIEARIVAIDRDPRALEAARRGVYSKSEAAGVPPRLRERYFVPVAGGYQAGEELRRAVRFGLGSIEESAEREVYDIVMCRNLLTYADEAGRREIAARVWEAMASYSYLLIGGSESLFGVDGRFEYVPNDWSRSYRKRAERPTFYGSASAPFD